MNPVRRYRPSDAAALHALFRRAVLEGAGAYYDPDQRRAWAGDAVMPAAWPQRLGNQTVWVAEAGKPVRLTGFMALTRDGTLDLAYVAPEAMGQGVAAGLYDHILTDAQQAGLQRLTTDASYFARSFFAKRGWRQEAEQRVERNGETLTNFRMSLDLSARG